MTTNALRHDRMMYGGIKLYAGSACPKLAEGIASYLEVPLCKTTITTFPNENLFVKLHTSVRGQDCYVIQTLSSPVHTNLMELLILIQTLRLDSAGRITAVFPYMCYSRSDKKDQPRVPITARLVADMIQTAGADRYMTLDLHADQIQGFFSIPGDVLYASHVLIEYLGEVKKKMVNPVLLSPDLGFAKKARNYAEELNIPLAFIEKRRIQNTDNPEVLTLIGDVQGRDIILLDEEVSTGKTIINAVNVATKNGARNVVVVFIHPILAGDAVEQMAKLPVKEFITTDTIPISKEKQAQFGGRLRIISVSNLIGEVVRRVNEGRSVGEMFNE
ncbi:MAG: ribose-phosphate diphosphokinase [Anaerolineaceae bacterium]